MKTHTLVIVYNEFHPNKGVKYLELIEKDGQIVEEKRLARKPRAARFDEVLENGSGSHNPWNAHRARRIHGHKLEKA